MYPPSQLPAFYFSVRLETCWTERKDIPKEVWYLPPSSEGIRQDLVGVFLYIQAFAQPNANTVIKVKVFEPHSEGD